MYVNYFRTMAECEVCCEVFDKGLQCPKILPCIHTLCVKCLRKLEKYGEIQCPFDRIFHSVPIGGVEKFPTNQQVLQQILAEKNKKTSPSLDGTPAVESRTESCKLHGKLLIIDDEIDGKFCETCLTIASSVVSQRKSVSAELSGQRSSNYQESERESVRNHAWNGAERRENESRLRGDFSRWHIEQLGAICPWHGTEKGFCETCLRHDFSGIWEQSDQHSQRLRNNASTRNSATGKKNEVGVFGTIGRLRTGLPIYQQSQRGNFATTTENEAGICALHGKPLIIYNETDGRLCETCLNLDSSIIAERESGSAGRTGPAASSDQQSQSSRARNSTTGEENEGVRCPLHQKPLIRITYNLMDGTVQRLCETCLNPDSYMISQRESRSGEHTEHDSRIHGLRFCEEYPSADFDNIFASGLNLSSSHESPRISSRAEICEQHGQPFTQFTYDVGQGEQRRFCKACFNPGSNTIPVPDVGNPDRAAISSSISTLQ